MSSKYSKKLNIRDNGKVLSRLLYFKHGKYSFGSQHIKRNIMNKVKGEFLCIITKWLMNILAILLMNAV